MTSRPIRIQMDDDGKYFMKNKKGKKIYTKGSSINLSKNKIQKLFINIYEKSKKTNKRKRKKIAEGSYRTVPLTKEEIASNSTSSVGASLTSANTGKDLLYMTDVEKGNQLIKQISDNRKNYYLTQGIIDPPSIAESGSKKNNNLEDRVLTLEDNTQSL